MVLVIISIAGSVICALFALLTGRPSPWWLYLLAVLFGLTGLSWNGVYLTRVGELADIALAGTATGLSFVIVNLGAIGGPPLFGYLVDLTGGYVLPWFFCGFCMALVVFLMAVQTKERMVRNQT